MVDSNKRPHESLEVYQLAHALGLRFHAMTFKLPSHELYEEGSQARRSAKSVSSQIVEGHALRQYKGEYLHYLARAYASAEETIEQIRNLLETGSARRVTDDCHELSDEYAILCRKLFNYRSSVQRKHDPSPPFEPREKTPDERSEKDNG
ncbi:MAG: four helix bundle protein [Chromatiales bacterium]|nr:four helix bundle protein [Chromatiales bacterium]